MEGNRPALTPPATARLTSSAVKYGRSGLSGSGKRQHTSHRKQVLLGTNCGTERTDSAEETVCAVDAAIEELLDFSLILALFPGTDYKDMVFRSMVHGKPTIP